MQNKNSIYYFDTYEFSSFINYQNLNIIYLEITYNLKLTKLS